MYHAYTFKRIAGCGIRLLLLLFWHQDKHTCILYLERIAQVKRAHTFEYLLVLNGHASSYFSNLMSTQDHVHICPSVTRHSRFEWTLGRSCSLLIEEPSASCSSQKVFLTQLSRLGDFKEFLSSLEISAFVKTCFIICFCFVAIKVNN